MGWQPGDVIVHQEVWRGRVWAARPLTVVEDTRSPAALAAERHHQEGADDPTEST